MEQKDIAVLTERMKHIDERITTLDTSYKTLNDHHHNLELDMIEFRTEIKTVTNLVKWLISPAMVIALLIELARLGGLIP